MALSVSRNPYTGLPDLIGTGGGGAGGSFSAGVSTLGNTLGTTGTVSNRIVFAGGANVTLSQSTNAGGATVTIIGGAGGGGGVAISGGTQLATSGTINFANSNGISFGLSGSSQLTASHNGITSQTAFVLSNSNGISFGTNGSTVTASYSVPSTAGLLSAINFSAGTTSNNSASIQFVNSNGISFGLNAGTITATVATNYLTSQSNQAFSASGGSSAFQTLNFANSNGITFSNSNGSVVASHNALTSQSNQAFSASGGSSAFQTLNFVNGNGATFTNNAGSVGISYTVPAVPAQTNQTLGLYASSNTTGAGSSTTVDARSFTVRGAGIISVGYSAGEMIVSASAAGAGDGVNILAAGTQTANTTGTVLFQNSNGVTFGMSNNSVITASVAAGGGGIANAAGTQTATSGTVVFANSNGITFGMSGSSQVTASYTVPSTAGLLSAVNFSAGTTSNNSASIQFVNGNGVSFGLNAGSISASVVTTYLTSQSNQAFSASGGSTTFQTLNFVNGNGATFTNNAGSVGISYTVPSVPAQTAQTLGLYAVSNTTGASSSSTVDARSLSFQGAGIASVGYSGGSVVISVPAGGGGGDGVNILAAGTQTANTTGTVLFQNSNGVTFGMSNNSVITASVAAGGAGNTVSDFVPPWALSGRATNSSIGQNTLYFMPFDVPDDVYGSRINFYPRVSISLETGNSTGTGQFGIGYGIYTRGTGASTERISQLTSYSMTFISHSNSSNNSVSLTHAFGLSNITSHSTFATSFATSNASTYVATNLNGDRALPMPLNLSMTPGRYYLGVMVSRTATSAVANSLSMEITSLGVFPEVRGLGFASAATNASVFRGGYQGLGSYSTTTNAFPVSIALSTDAIRAAVNATLIHFDIKGYGYSSNVL